MGLLLSSSLLLLLLLLLSTTITIIITHDDDNKHKGRRTHSLTHTHTQTHTRQGAAVQPSVNPVPSRPLVGGLFHRPSCVCVCPLYWVRTARVRVSVAVLCLPYLCLGLFPL